MPPAPSPAMASAGEVTAPPRNPFPFQHKPNALDRDKIVIPAGWDSWGKITVLRDGFDAKLWGEAWENDLDGADDDAGPKATKLYASLVPDLSRKVRDELFASAVSDAYSCSHRLYLLSTTPHQSKYSLPRTTTRTRRTRTEILVAHSAIRTRLHQLVSSAQWAAAASTCRTSNAHLRKWKAPRRQVPTP